MKPIKKLTPAVIKRIIAEEREKLGLEKTSGQTVSMTENDVKTILEEVDNIKNINKKASKLLEEYKKLINAKKILQKRLLRRL